MPLVLDYIETGAIVSGHFYNFVPSHAVESGIWQVVIEYAVYARAAHFIAPPTSCQGLGAATGIPEADKLDTVQHAQGVNAGDRDEQQSFVPIEDTASGGERFRTSFTTQAPSPKRRRLDSRRCLQVTLPIAVDVETGSGIASIANSAIPDKRGTPRATQIPHVGPILPSRRAILSRADRPYICHLCGGGFAHPVDAKSHFHGRGDGGCWARNGSPPDQAFDQHPSCKVSEADVRFVRCREGWVIVDQASWDAIRAATDAGRKFKGAGRLEGWVANERTVQTPQPAPQMRKVVRAGDETETDVGPRRK